MSELIEKSTDMDKNEKETFEFSKDIDGVRKTVSGRQVENGWVICFSKSWTEPETGEYKHESSEYITKNNPLDKVRDSDAKIEEDSDILNSIKDISQGDGMLLVS